MLDPSQDEKELVNFINNEVPGYLDTEHHQGGQEEDEPMHPFKKTDPFKE